MLTTICARHSGTSGPHFIGTESASCDAVAIACYSFNILLYSSVPVHAAPRLGHAEFCAKISEILHKAFPDSACNVHQSFGH